MKVIQLHKSDKKRIQQACANSRNAQRELYEKYAPKMGSVCRYYVKDVHEAEDVMLIGFFKAFKNLKSYSQENSFEGWLRKIMVNECISFHRKKKCITIIDSYETSVVSEVDSVYANYDVEELQSLINQLPDGYKMVFMLFAVEGYSHKEIAKQLNVTISTSKSQLFKARKMLQEKINSLKNGTR